MYVYALVYFFDLGDPRGRRRPGSLDQLCGGGTASVSLVLF